MTEAPSRLPGAGGGLSTASGRSAASAATDKVFQDVQMVLVQLRPHLQRLADGDPARFLGVIATAYVGQFASDEIEVESVRDGAPAQAALGVIEHPALLQ